MDECRLHNFNNLLDFFFRKANRRKEKGRKVKRNAFVEHIDVGIRNFE